MDDSVTFYNMGFGDASIISNVPPYFDHHSKEENPKVQEAPFNLLVDFGSKNSEKNADKLSKTIKCACDEIIRRMSMKGVEQNLLITHFHNDHTKFIPKLRPKSIDNLYIRNIYSDGGAIYTFNLAKLFFAALTEDEWEEAWDTLSSISGMFAKLNDKSNIIFVREGARIVKGNFRFDVLSPFANERYYPEDQTNFLSEQLAEFDNPLISRFLRLFRELQSFINESKKEDREREEILCLSQNNLEEFDTIVSRVTGPFSEGEYYEQVKAIWKENKNNKQLRKSLSDCEHRFNVVFEDRNKGLLFCGDEESDDMMKILTKKIENGETCYYHIAKFPHQGTTSHFILESFKNKYIDYRTDIGVATLSKRQNYGGLDTRYAYLSRLLVVNDYESFCPKNVHVPSYIGQPGLKVSLHLLTLALDFDFFQCVRSFV